MVPRGSLGLQLAPLVIKDFQSDPFVSPSVQLQEDHGNVPDVPQPRHLRDGGMNEDEAWQVNPYWRYFRRVWGDAPFIDSNFKLWLSGLFKGDFDKPKRPVPGQTTKGLPAAMHYFSSKYVCV